MSSLLMAHHFYSSPFCALCCNCEVRTTSVIVREGTDVYLHSYVRFFTAFIGLYILRVSFLQPFGLQQLGETDEREKCYSLKLSFAFFVVI